MRANRNVNNNKSVIIYRDKLLPYSQTFIISQAENISEYTAFYTGIERIQELDLFIADDRIATLSDITPNSVFWKKAFRLANVLHPQWLKHLRDLSPCLIHCHFGTDGFWAAKLARKIGVPLIVTFHGYDITKQLSAVDSFENSEIKHHQKNFQKIANVWNDFLATLIYELPVELSKIPNWLTPDYVLSEKRRLELVFREADCIIAISEFIHSKLIEKGCPAEKIKVHYIGVDTDKFQADPKIQRQPIVLFVGRLVEKKGCEYLIRAMAQVQKTMPDVELVIIGDGDLRSKLENLAADLLSNYRFLGVQTPKQVKIWMNKSSVFSVPSIIAKSGDTEGFGIVFAEAQAMGLPVVSCASGGILEAVYHNETGFLAPEKDIQILSKYIVTLLKNNSLREQFAIAGRKRVEERFNLKYNNEQLEKIYTSILSN